MRIASKDVKAVSPLEWNTNEKNGVAQKGKYKIENKNEI